MNEDEKSSLEDKNMFTKRHSDSAEPKFSESSLKRKHFEIEETISNNEESVAVRLAVCYYCGYLSKDFNHCQRCRKKLSSDVKIVLARKNQKEQKNVSTHTNREEIPLQQSSEKPPESSNVTLKFVQARCAVCSNCGFISEDFNHCQRCRKKLSGKVKIISVKKKKASIPITTKSTVSTSTNSK